jgi:NADH:ubiquinone oxidoreductase subunit E
MKKLLVCTNFRANPNQPSCAGRGSKQIMLDLALQLQQQNVKIKVEESMCMGYCKIGPNLRLAPNGEFFHAVSEEKLTAIIQACQAFTAK